MGFFTGHGYSDAFSRHMRQLLAYLQAQPQTQVRLTSACDLVCRHCPHNNQGVCVSAAKVTRYDAGVLSLCMLSLGDTLAFSALIERVREQIILPGKRPLICADCQWQSLCAATSYQLSFPRFQSGDALVL